MKPIKAFCRNHYEKQMRKPFFIRTFFFSKTTQNITQNEKPNSSPNLVRGFRFKTQFKLFGFCLEGYFTSFPSFTKKPVEAVEVQRLACSHSDKETLGAETKRR